MDIQSLVNEIEAIKVELDQSHDVDPDYLPPYVKELRNYIFQIHTSFEQSMDILLIQTYLKSDKPYETHLPLLEQITFDGKMKLVGLNAPKFPIKTAKKINYLRNEFAHKRGIQIRNTYKDKGRLKIYQRLKRWNAELNDFWQSQKLDHDG